MWNSASLNKLIKADEVLKVFLPLIQNYQQHQHNLATIKPIIHIKTPYQPGFIYTKPKLEMSRRGMDSFMVDRLREIDKQNRLLLNKLDKIYENGENIPK